MKLGQKIKLNPTPEQEKYFIQACNAARVVYNWALAEWERQVNMGQKPSAFKLDKQFNAIKRERYPWICAVSKSVAQGAIRDLGTAFKNFFNNPDHYGYPRFKKKEKCKESFYLQPDQFVISGNYVRIPKLDKFTKNKELKWVNMARCLRFRTVGNQSIRILSARISRKAGQWYISIQIELPEMCVSHPNPNNAAGIDLGIEKLATVSTGEIIENIRALRKSMKKLKRWQRKLARQEAGSHRYFETKIEIQRIHSQITNRRQDHIHKMTTYLAREFGFIAIEDLNVLGMMKNHRLAQSISDASFGEIVRQLEYKVEAHGGRLQKVGRFFPSSKTCSKCGKKNNTLTLSDRVYKCLSCGLTIDRDLNAALNILAEGLRLSEI